MWLGIVQLILINLILSIDNAVLIALVTKDLTPKNKKKATFWGTTGAILLRFVFILIVLLLINLIGDNAYMVFIICGGALIIIGLLLTSPKKPKENKVIENLWKSIGIILAADAMMSLENSLIVVNQAMRLPVENWIANTDPNSHAYEVWAFVIQMVIILIALLISIPVIVFGIDALDKFMKKNHWFEYVAAVLIIAAGLEMIVDDPIIKLIFGEGFEELTNIPSYGISIISYSIAIVLSGGKYLIYDRYRLEEIHKFEANKKHQK